VGVALVRLLLTRLVVEETRGGSMARRAAVPLVLLATVALIPLLGFGAAGLVMGLALMLVAHYGAGGPRYWLALTLGVGGTILLFTAAFRNLLGVPLPSGLLM